MTQRYLARGEIDTGSHVIRAIVALGVAAGAAVFFAHDKIVGAAIFIPSFILFVVCESWAALQRSRRVWLDIQPDSFVVRDRKGERSYRDVQVAAVAYFTKNLYSNGNAHGFQRTAKLWMGSETEPLIVENKIKEGKADPLGEFLKRVMDFLSAGFSHGLEQGLILEGEGWSLNQSHLSFAQRGGLESIPIEDIYAVEDHDGKMGVWRRGEELPTVQFPCVGRNIWLLRNVLSPRIKKDANESPPANGLGRILFQRNAKKFWVVFMGLLAAGPMLAGATMMIRMPIDGAIMAGGGILVGLLVFLYSRTSFRCHEWGVYKKGYFGEGRLLYNDVKNFTYSATRHYHNGAYIGTYLKLKFETISPDKGSSIVYNTRVSGADDELDRLRNLISMVIADRMSKELAAANRTPWTPNIAFLEKGFEFRPAGIFSRKEPVFLPYENYGGSTFSAGQFHLFEKGNKKSVMTIGSAEVNFFPGWFLLQRLFKSQ